MTDNATTIAYVQFNEVSGGSADRYSRFLISFATMPQTEARAIFGAYTQDGTIRNPDLLSSNFRNFENIPARFVIDVVSGQITYAEFRHGDQKPATVPDYDFDVTFHQPNGVDFISDQLPKLEGERRCYVKCNPDDPEEFRAYTDSAGRLKTLEFSSGVLEPKSHFGVIRLNEEGHIETFEYAYANKYPFTIRYNGDEVTMEDGIHHQRQRVQNSPELDSLKAKAEQAVLRARQILRSPFSAPRIDGDTMAKLLKAVKNHGIRASRTDGNVICGLGPAAAEIRGPDASDGSFYAASEGILSREPSFTGLPRSKSSFVVEADRFIKSFPGLAGAGDLKPAEAGYETIGFYPHNPSGAGSQEFVLLGLKHLVR
jgi:hypothetical protein